jgi:hypothetical protein
MVYHNHVLLVYGLGLWSIRPFNLSRKNLGLGRCIICGSTLEVLLASFYRGLSVLEGNHVLLVYDLGLWSIIIMCSWSMVLVYGLSDHLSELLRSSERSSKNAPLIMSVIPSNLYASRPYMCTTGICQG